MWSVLSTIACYTTITRNTSFCSGHNRISLRTRMFRRMKIVFNQHTLFDWQIHLILLWTTMVICTIIVEISRISCLTKIITAFILSWLADINSRHTQLTQTINWRSGIYSQRTSRNRICMRLCYLFMAYWIGIWKRPTVYQQNITKLEVKDKQQKMQYLPLANSVIINKLITNILQIILSKQTKQKKKQFPFYFKVRKLFHFS